MSASAHLDRVEQRAHSRGWRTLRADWNERGDRLYLKVWRDNAVPVTFAIIGTRLRYWPESVDNTDLLDD